MSCSRGSTNRTRPQKHQNKSAFKNTLHDTSKKTKLLNNLEITGVCERCKEIIEWKIKYKKYKPLTAPKKCADCDQKNIKHAYHILCRNCASDKNVCTKCCKPIEVSRNLNFLNFKLSSFDYGKCPTRRYNTIDLSTMNINKLQFAYS